ncbi:MAG: hypothetical protein MHMPM18_002907, partial [Marteilia pararefringens]
MELTLKEILENLIKKDEIRRTMEYVKYGFTKLGLRGVEKLEVNIELIEQLFENLEEILGFIDPESEDHVDDLEKVLSNLRWIFKSVSPAVLLDTIQMIEEIEYVSLHNLSIQKGIVECLEGLNLFVGKLERKINVENIEE